MAPRFAAMRPLFKTKRPLLNTNTSQPLFVLVLLATSASAFNHHRHATPRHSAARRPTALAARGTQYSGAFPGELSEGDKVARAFPSLAEPAAALLPPEVVAASSACLLGLSLYLGPDWLLAPLGLESQIRPGRETSYALGKVLLERNSTFLAERAAGYAAEPPPELRAATAAVYGALGAAAQAALVAALGSASYVGAWAVCAALAGVVYEVGRPQPLSRDVADARESFESSFEDFAERRFDYSTSAATNTIEIVRAFRRSVGKYRSADASVADVQIERLAKTWWRQRGGVVTSTGFLKGVKLKAEADVFDRGV